MANLTFNFQFNVFNKQMTEVSRDLWVMNKNKNKHIYKTSIDMDYIVKNPLFRQSGILNISDLYQIEVMTFMHDFANEKLPVSFNDVYKMNCNIHGIYETRQAHLLHIPRTKSRFVDRLPLYQVPEICN